jgi:hypothetical protein
MRGNVTVSGAEYITITFGCAAPVPRERNRLDEYGNSASMRVVVSDSPQIEDKLVTPPNAKRSFHGLPNYP